MSDIYDDTYMQDTDAEIYNKAYQQGRADAIEEFKSLVFEFDDYCDARSCLDCWMYTSNDCLKQWVNSKLEQLKEQNNERD